MILPKTKRLNDDEQRAVRDNANMSNMEKVTLCTQLIDSLEATNGDPPDIKLQRVSECVEQQARNFSMLFRIMRDTAATNKEMAKKNTETNNRIESKIDSFINKCEIIEKYEDAFPVEAHPIKERTYQDVLVECKKEIATVVIFIAILAMIYPEMVAMIKSLITVFVK